MRNITIALLALFLLQATVGAAEADWFTFAMPCSDTSTTVTHAGMLLNDAPAGRHGRLGVKDGHFHFADGTRARFWGVNVVSNGNFPSQADAPMLAARLEKLGYNMVRIHGIDMPEPNGLLYVSAGDRQTLSVSQLDKLDYYIYQLKLHGIYVNINLHVNRAFTEVDGVVDAALIPEQSKAVSVFDDRIITLQKDYAQKLLSHVNPYTGLSYADDPAIATVEINNENNLLREWELGRLFGKPNSDGTLTPYYLNELDQKWNRWLSAKYINDEALLDAWRPGSEAGGINQAVNPGFEQPLSTEWVRNFILPATGQFSLDTVEKAGGNYSMKITVSSRTADSWRARLYQCGFVAEKGIRYVVRFKGMADTPHATVLIFSQNSPSVNYGLSLPIMIAGPWRQYEYHFVASTNTSANPADLNYARFGFHVGLSTGTVWLDDVEFSSAPIYALQQYESLAHMNVERTTWTDCGRFSARRICDNAEFYASLEKDYYSGMINYIRSVIGVKSLITTTSQFFGELNLLSRADGDYMDQHGYWDHPQYLLDNTNKVFKQNNNSFVSETSLLFESFLNRGPLLAANNKPFVLSEFNHCFPNQYEYEMLPIMAAFGLLQDWDGLVLHSFSRDQIYDANYITNNFLSKHNSVKLAQMPMCALIFRRGYIQQAQRQLTADYSKEDAITNHVAMVPYRPLFMVGGSSLPVQALLKYRVRKNIDMPRSSLIDEVLPAVERDALQSAAVVASDTGEMVWNRYAGAGYVTFNSPYFQGADGFISGKTIELSKLTLAMETNSAAYVVSIDSSPIGSTGRMLLTVAGRQENTGQVKDENNGLLSLGGAPVLMEPVRGRVSLTVAHSPYNCKVYALDGYGQRKSTATVSVVDKTISFMTGDDETPWYEIVVPPDTVAPRPPKKFKKK
ncbi:MAG: hypothetical protein A2219_05760 [Elusimicrobia bacterium RIFOXYA2_FULL_50_26]|nr:MAG: hypothetical protein A2219_05760 [Elusimicrobia bacterium RIFOXYA2_FULL_50_26]